MATLYYKGKAINIKYMGINSVIKYMLDNGGTIATYTITNRLTGCTTSNSVTSITRGSSYSTTITANSNYILGSITVTMGGTNITSSVVSGNRINISNVTGNVVITCTATHQSSGGGGNDENIVTNYTPNGSSFIFDKAINFERGDYIEASIDLSTCQLEDENIISIGNNIADWEGSYNYHLYYGVPSHNMALYATGTNSKIIYSERNIGFTDLIVTVNSEGIHINGELITIGYSTEYQNLVDYLNSISSVQIGSQEADIRSHATYNYIKVVTGSGTVTSTPVKSVSINRTSKSVNIGNSFTLTAAISPSNATNKNVTWSVNNNNCSITPDGLSCTVNANNAGSSIITVRTDDGGYTATCNVTVVSTVVNPDPTPDPDPDPNAYTIPISSYGIYNDNTNPVSTTRGINNAITDAMNNGYTSIKLPAGHYAIEVDSVQGVNTIPGTEYNWEHKLTGVVMKDNLKLDLTGCTLELEPSDADHYGLITFSCCNNATLIGGTLIGDRYTHDYDIRINDNGDELEVGSLSASNGQPIDDDTHLRTKNFIDVTSEMKEGFKLIPLQGTNCNVTDGGRYRLCCYDSNYNFLGIVETWENGYSGYLDGISSSNLPANTSKIKIAFWHEYNLEEKWYIYTYYLPYATLEWGSGILFTDAKNCTVNGTKSIDFIGDCIGVNCPPVDTLNENITISNCTLENSRRQGISITGPTDGFLVENTNIGYINGIDPQYGVDIELETGEAVNVVFRGCHFYMNKRGDFDHFNGSDTLLDSCEFNGFVAAVFGQNLKIHNCTFEHKLSDPNPKNDHPICDKAGVQFAEGGEGNELIGNLFTGQNSVYMPAQGAQVVDRDNIFENGAERW